MTDDPTIADSEGLLRRIHPTQVVDDGAGGRRPSSAAFTDSSDGTSMSVIIESLLAATGRGPQDVLQGYPGFTLAAVTAGFARSLGQGVVRKPVPDEPAHGEVVGPKTGDVKRSFAREARWVVGPA